MNQRIEKLLEQVQVNEQIAHLAKQAGCTIDRLGYGEGNLEKFAELIVAECVSVGRTAFLNDHSTVPVFPAEKIKKHFGVEE